MASSKEPRRCACGRPINDVPPSGLSIPMPECKPARKEESKWTTEPPDEVDDGGWFSVRLDLQLDGKPTEIYMDGDGEWRMTCVNGRNSPENAPWAVWVSDFGATRCTTRIRFEE